MSGNLIVFGVSSRSTLDASNRVMLLDTVTGREKLLTGSRWAQGIIQWQAVTGHWVAWTDQSRIQTDDDANALWRVWAKDLRSGKRCLLASNGQQANPYVPHVVAGKGRFVWAEAEPDRTAKELIWNTEHTAEKPRIVGSHLRLVPGSETLTGSDLVYLGPPALKRPGDSAEGGDCWSTPLAGGPPHPLTRSGLVLSCAVSAGTMVWSERRRGSDSSDPFSYWSRVLGSGQPMLLHKGATASRYPVAGSGFAAWMPHDAAYLLHSTSGPDDVLLSPGQTAYVPLGSAASGDSFAYATNGSGPLTLIVVTTSTPN